MTSGPQPSPAPMECRNRGAPGVDRVERVPLRPSPNHSDWGSIAGYHPVLLYHRRDKTLTKGSDNKEKTIFFGRSCSELCSSVCYEEGWRSGGLVLSPQMVASPSKHGGDRMSQPLVSRSQSFIERAFALCGACQVYGKVKKALARRNPYLLAANKAKTTKPALPI